MNGGDLWVTKYEGGVRGPRNGESGEYRGKVKGGIDCNEGLCNYRETTE